MKALTRTQAEALQVIAEHVGRYTEFHHGRGWRSFAISRATIAALIRRGLLVEAPRRAPRQPWQNYVVIVTAAGYEALKEI